jgi:hypothetical protein
MRFKRYNKALLAALTGIMLMGPMGLGFSQELDTEQILPPLVDTSVPQEQDPPEQASVSPPASKKMVLNAKVQTLQEAIVSEQNIVNWYAWYLACREYLSRTGGLKCELGTPIKFYKGGRIEALTLDPMCLVSVSGRRFDLPQKTSLDALILPVRNGYNPPATPQEIYSRVEANKFK